jgi:hypothetical protein
VPTNGDGAAHKGPDFGNRLARFGHPQCSSLEDVDLVFPDLHLAGDPGREESICHAFDIVEQNLA